MPKTKLEILQQYNMMLVAALYIDKNETLHVEDLVITEKDCDFGEEIAFFAFIRDIDYDKGFHLLTERNDNNANFNALAICSPKLFSIPQSFILKPEYVEELMAQ